MRTVRKVFSKQFCFIICEKLPLWTAGLRKYSIFTFVESTINDLPKVQSFQDVIKCFFISICKFDNFKDPFAMITSLSELTLDSDLLCWWIMAGAQAAENHGDEWGLTLNLWLGIYTSIPTWTKSQNSLAAAEKVSLKISYHGTSLKWSKRSS